VLAGTAAVRPGNVTNGTDVFDGWRTDSDLGPTYDFGAPVTGDITLYAPWIAEATVNTADFSAAPDNTFNVSTAAEWASAVNAINTGGDNKNYVINLTANVSIPGEEPDGSSATFRYATGLKVSLRGGGSLALASGYPDTGYLLDVWQQTVILRTTLKGKASNITPVVQVGGNGGTLIMPSGVISGNTATDSIGGVYIYGNGVFNMSGSAKISGNTGSIGGVSLNANDSGDDLATGALFTMSDNAEISDNTGSGIGGVFILGGTFIKTGGTINSNTGTGLGQLFVYQKSAGSIYSGVGRNAAVGIGVTVTGTNSAEPYTYNFVPVRTDPFWDSDAWE
jgi:hypothetical protein